MKPFKYKGKTQIWYMKSETWGAYGPSLTPPKDLSRTHILLGCVDEVDLEDIFTMMQGEVWSPNGEARDYIKSLGLIHTSMSEGDIIVLPDGTRHMVALFGFKEV